MPDDVKDPKTVDWAALAAPFPADDVKWRLGTVQKDKKRGLALPYIDARCVMDRLDSVVGPANWKDSYRVESFTVQTDQGPISRTAVICTVSICTDGTWVSKEDGAGAPDFEPEKGALSDAFKRAAVKWGIFRYGYDLPSAWVDVRERGRSWEIASTPILPDWALPSDERKKPPAQQAEPQRANAEMTQDQLARYRRAIDELCIAHQEVWEDALRRTSLTMVVVNSCHKTEDSRRIVTMLKKAVTELEAAREEQEQTQEPTS